MAKIAKDIGAAPDFVALFPAATVRDVEGGTPIERKLGVDDVLAWRESENQVAIVTIDGRRFEVAK